MNVHTLLSDAADTVGTPVHPSTVRADLARGHRAIARRRLRRGGVTGLVVAGAIAGAFAVVGPSGPATTTATGGVDPTLDAGAIQLVDYTGEQLAGYSVDEVPEGWALLGADEYALTIGPAGVPDTDPNSYVGKLTVLLMSKDATLPTEGTPVSVGSVEGTVVDNSGEVRRDGSPAPFSSTLFYVDPASGQPVSVQVPGELNWTPEQVAAFAQGVHVTDAAVRGVG